MAQVYSFCCADYSGDCGGFFLADSAGMVSNKGICISSRKSLFLDTVDCMQTGFVIAGLSPEEFTMKLDLYVIADKFTEGIHAEA